MKEIKIKVIGECNTGKSTVAQLIADALSLANIDFNVIDEDMHPGWLGQQPARLAALSEGQLFVEVETIQERRKRS